MADTGILEGIKTGAGIVQNAQDWAGNQMQLDLQRQNIQNQQDQLAQHKKEFQVAQGRQIYDMMTDASMELGEDVKRDKIKGIESFAKEAGVNIDSTWLASLKDKHYQPKYSELIKAVQSGADNPAALDAFFQRMTNALGSKATMGLLEKSITGIQTINAVQLKAAASQNVAEIGAKARVEAAQVQGATRQQNLTYRTEKEVRSDLNSKLKSPEFMFQSIKRFNNLLEAPQTTDLKATTQWASKLANEMSILETGGRGITSEGSRERGLVDTYAQRFAAFKQKLKNAPQDAVAPAFVDQMRAEVNEMKKAWMDTTDASLSSMTGGAYENQQRIIEDRHKAFTKQYGGLLGGWEGVGLEKAAPATYPGQTPKPAEEQKPAEKIQRQPTAQELQQALALKSAINKISDPKTRAAAILKSHKALGDVADILFQKVGIK